MHYLIEETLRTPSSIWLEQALFLGGSGVAYLPWLEVLFLWLSFPLLQSDAVAPSLQHRSPALISEGRGGRECDKYEIISNLYIDNWNVLLVQHIYIVVYVYSITHYII